jgi:excisionase family DNA binding protein
VIEKITYSIDEFMQASSLGRTTVYELLGSGQLDSVKVGRRRIIPADSVRAFLESRRERNTVDDGGTAA